MFVWKKTGNYNEEETLLSSKSQTVKEKSSSDPCQWLMRLCVCASEEYESPLLAGSKGLAWQFLKIWTRTNEWETVCKDVLAWTFERTSWLKFLCDSVILCDCYTCVCVGPCVSSISISIELTGQQSAKMANSHFRIICFTLEDNPDPNSYHFKPG